LVRKIEEIYARRRNKVKVGEQEGEWFGTTKGVRQDCLLSPLGLSTIYVCGRYRPNVKESKRRGRSMVGRERKILVIVAKRERNERNDEESGKVCEEEKSWSVFNKRKRKSEENEFNCLGYTFNERATGKAHMREIVRKVNVVVECVWGIGERKCGGDFRRRMMTFESKVESVLMYGAEIWR
jgi:hypothetical protein